MICSTETVMNLLQKKSIITKQPYKYLVTFYLVVAKTVNIFKAFSYDCISC